MKKETGKHKVRERIKLVRQGKDGRKRIFPREPKEQQKKTSKP